MDRGRGERGPRGRDRTPGGRGGRGDDVPRSANPLLEEFKSSKSRKIEMKVRGAAPLQVVAARSLDPAPSLPHPLPHQLSLSPQTRPRRPPRTS
jgi:hypothetical protein